MINSSKLLGFNLCQVSMTILLILFSYSCNDATKPDEDNMPTEPEGQPPEKPLFTLCHAAYEEPYRAFQLFWSDRSDNEDGFILEKMGPNDAQFVTLANLSSNTDHYDYLSSDIESDMLYRFRIQAYNELGESAWDEISQRSVGLKSGSVTVKVSADTYVKESQADNNYGTSNVRVAGYDNNHENALLQFSLPNLPTHAKEFKSASLILCEAGGGNTIYPGIIGLYAAPILDSWNENSVTWNSRPGTLLSTYGYGVHDPNSTTCVYIDVSEVVSDWYSGVRTNYGFNVFSGSQSYVSYYSREVYEPGSAAIKVEYWW